MKKLIMVIIVGVILQQTVFSGVTEKSNDLMKEIASDMANERDANMQKILNRMN